MSEDTPLRAYVAIDSESGDSEIEERDKREAIMRLRERRPWEGEPRPITVDAARTEPLLGTELLWGYELRVQYTDGGHVEIEAV